jgi:DNA-binding CsgD family transcriptional regulator
MPVSLSPLPLRNPAVSSQSAEKVSTIQVIEPREALAALTDKQREVMNLVCEDFSYKEIARKLRISVRTVEQRVAAARSRLGTRDRASTARAYRRLMAICGQTTYGSHQLDSASTSHLTTPLDAGTSPVFTLGDAGFDGFWANAAPLEIRPRGDDVWGRVHRFGIIIVIALGLASALALVISVMHGLNDLL